MDTKDHILTYSWFFQEIEIQQSTGDFQPKEVKTDENAAEEKPDEQKVRKESTGDFQPNDACEIAEECIPDENYIDFVIVDEQDRPLGVAEIASEGDGAAATSVPGIASVLENPGIPDHGQPDIQLTTPAESIIGSDSGEEVRDFIEL